MGSEDQALTVQSKKSRTYYHKGKHSHQKDNPRRSKRNIPKFRCYTFDERGHFARDCPRNKNGSHKKKGNKKRHHAHTVEDDKPPKKRIKQESDDSSSDEEYVLISSHRGNITHGAMIGL